MKYFLLLVLTCAFIDVSAQDFNVMLIPDSLRKSADVVKRLEEYRLELKSPGKAVEYRKVAYTILNSDGDDNARFYSLYDAFEKIADVSGTLYDASGKKVKHFKKSDMEDHSYEESSSLFMDDRYKLYSFYCKAYPYTVVFEEEKDWDGILSFKRWDPLEEPGMALQMSNYTLTVPKNYKIRYRQLNCNLEPKIAETNSNISYSWELKNIKAIQKESSWPGWKSIAPIVLLAPSEFEASGYKGNMSSWKEYGTFLYQLIKGRDGLPENVKKKVHEIADNIRDPREKIFALYNYLQQNTRYISIQLGIGGWQPFDANFVATKNYGDCKALSNYMIALLKEAGIKGKYVEIYGGKDFPDLVEDFPSFQSNHVICCVPMEKDSIWLECTSQNESAGYMGSFTGNRKAILIDEDGGHVVRTPSYTSHDNQELRSINAIVDANGNMEANVKTQYVGIEQEAPFWLITDYNKEERLKILNQEFELPTYEVTGVEYERFKSSLPKINEKLTISSKNYANVSGRRLFVMPNLLSKSRSRYSADSVRIYDIVVKYPYKDVDSVTIKIPQGYISESVPAEMKLDTKFGKYACQTKVDGDRIIYYRSFEHYSGRFAPSEYQDIVKFYEQVFKADRNRVVLVKKDM